MIMVNNPPQPVQRVRSTEILTNKQTAVKIYRQIRPAILAVPSYRHQSLRYVYDAFSLRYPEHTYPTKELLFQAFAHSLRRKTPLPAHCAVPVFFAGYGMDAALRIINFGVSAIAVSTLNKGVLYYTAINKAAAGAPAIFTSQKALIEALSPNLFDIRYLGWSTKLGNQSLVALDTNSNLG